MDSYERVESVEDAFAENINMHCFIPYIQLHDHVDTAPSKWIIKAIEEKKLYRYNKPMSGAQVTKDIGMNKLMDCCAHFKSWIDRLIAIVQQ